MVCGALATPTWAYRSFVWAKAEVHANELAKASAKNIELFNLNFIVVSFWVAEINVE
jgi:hypothetical protein